MLWRPQQYATIRKIKLTAYRSWVVALTNVYSNYLATKLDARKRCKNAKLGLLETSCFCRTTMLAKFAIKYAGSTTFDTIFLFKFDSASKQNVLSSCLYKTPFYLSLFQPSNSLLLSFSFLIVLHGDSLAYACKDLLQKSHRTTVFAATKRLERFSWGHRQNGHKDLYWAATDMHIISSNFSYFGRRSRRCIMWLLIHFNALSETKPFQVLEFSSFYIDYWLVLKAQTIILGLGPWSDRMAWTMLYYYTMLVTT